MKLLHQLRSFSLLHQLLSLFRLLHQLLSSLLVFCPSFSLLRQLLSLSWFQPPSSSCQ